MRSCTQTGTAPSRLAAIVILGGVAAGAQQPSIGPAPGRLIDVGGYKLHIHCIGEGAPTVVIDGGAGAWSIHFTHIQKALSGARVCTYDAPDSDGATPGRPHARASGWSRSCTRYCTAPASPRRSCWSDTRSAATTSGSIRRVIQRKSGPSSCSTRHTSSSGIDYRRRRASSQRRAWPGCGNAASKRATASSEPKTTRPLASSSHARLRRLRDVHRATRHGNCGERSSKRERLMAKATLSTRGQLGRRLGGFSDRCTAPASRRSAITIIREFLADPSKRERSIMKMALFGNHCIGSI